MGRSGLPQVDQARSHPPQRLSKTALPHFLLYCVFSCVGGDTNEPQPSGASSGAYSVGAAIVYFSGKLSLFYAFSRSL